MRKVQFKVRDCTHHLNRIPPTPARLERIALITRTRAARQRTGFSGIEFCDDPEDEDVPATTE